jgi:tetratricopeptide (TPR) repeat protein
VTQRRRRAFTATCVATTLFAGGAAAQEAKPGASQESKPGASASPAEAAAALFLEGRAAMAERRYDVACSEFSESFRLDPHVGSVISLAECEAAAGHLAGARQNWQEALDLARRLGDKREADAADELAKIDVRVPRLTLNVAPGLTPDSVIRADGAAVSRASLGVPLPVDVGDHVVRVSSPGFEENTTTVTVAEGEKKALVLELGPPVAAPLAAVVALPKPAEIAPVRASPLRPIAVAAGSLGVVALAIGSGFGIAALNAKSSPRGVCDPGCNAAANARNTALAEGNASTGLFIGGAALVVGGVVAWVLAPRFQASITPTIGGLRVAASF